MLQINHSDFADLFAADHPADHDTEYQPATVSHNPIKLSPEELAAGQSATQDNPVPSCGFCGNDMPEDRIQIGKKGGQYKYCTTQCQRRAADSAKVSRIVSVNKTLTKEINKFQGDARRKLQNRIFREYVLFRIGFYRDDPATNVKMRLQAEAVSNKFIFGNRDDKSAYNYILKFANDTYPTLKDSFYDANTLEYFAKAIGWVQDDYVGRYPAPVMLTDHQRQVIDSISYDKSVMSVAEAPASPATAPTPAPATAPAPKAETLADLTDQQIYSAIITKAASYPTTKSDQWPAWTFQRITGRNLPAGLSHTTGTLFASVDAAIRKSQADYKRNQRQQTSSTATDEAPTSNDPRKIILTMIPAKASMTTPDGIHMKMERDHGTSREESSRILNDLMSEGLVTRDPCSPTFLIRGKV